MALQHQSTYQRNACSMSSGGERKRDGDHGIPLLVPPPSLLFPDTSRTGSGANMQDLTTAGVWTKEELDLHVNILEMKAFQLALNLFRDWIMGGSVVLMSDNATVVACLIHLIL